MQVAQSATVELAGEIALSRLVKNYFASISHHWRYVVCVVIARHEVAVSSMRNDTTTSIAWNNAKECAYLVHGSDTLNKNGDALKDGQHRVNTAQYSAQFFWNRYAQSLDATYNLIYNASLLVEDGLGYALGFDKLINVDGDSALCFRPLSPAVTVTGTLIWKRYQVLSPAVRLFAETLCSNI